MCNCNPCINMHKKMNTVRNLCGTKAVDGFSREERQLVRTEGKSQSNSKPKTKTKTLQQILREVLTTTLNKTM